MVPRNNEEQDSLLVAHFLGPRQAVLCLQQLVTPQNPQIGVNLAKKRIVYGWWGRGSQTQKFFNAKLVQVGKI